MISFKEFLIEGVSPILYHHTGVHKLVSILKDDKFRLASDLGTASDQMYKGKKFKPFYFSTSRIKYGGYARSFGNSEQVNLVLDGTKLSHNLSGKSVDYWGPSFRRPSVSLDMRLRNQENEDRIFSPTSIIENAHEYIKEIHIMVDKNYLLINSDYKAFEKLSLNDQHNAWERNRMYKKILDYSNVYSIPVYFYEDFESFMLLNKKKVKSGMGGRPEKINLYVELFDKDEVKDLSSEADDLRYEIVYHNYRGDSLATLNNDIHNNKSDEIKSMSVEKLVKRMHRYKLKSTKEVIEFLSNKWKDAKVRSDD